MSKLESVHESQYFSALRNRPSVLEDACERRKFKSCERMEEPSPLQARKSEFETNHEERNRLGRRLTAMHGSEHDKNPFHANPTQFNVTFFDFNDNIDLQAS